MNPNSAISAPKRLRVAAVQMIFASSIPGNLQKIENAVYYVFANSVGPQGGGKWSAGDSKIVAPDGSFLRLTGNRREQLLVEDLDLSQATRKYALDSLKHPHFLASHWRRMLPELRQRGREADQMIRRWFESAGSASIR